VPARKPGRGNLEQTLGQREVGQHRGHPRLDVGTSEGEVALECGGVAVVSAGRSRGELVGGGLESRLGGGDAGSACEELAEGFFGVGLGLLGEVTDRGTGRGERDGAGVGGVQAREDAQQRGLADAVRPEHTHAGLRADDEVDADEDRCQAASLRHPVGGECGERSGCSEGH
jgi:hypothetical protein